MHCHVSLFKVFFFILLSIMHPCLSYRSFLLLSIPAFLIDLSYSHPSLSILSILPTLLYSFFVPPLGHIVETAANGALGLARMIEGEHNKNLANFLPLIFFLFYLSTSFTCLEKSMIVLSQLLRHF